MKKLPLCGLFLFAARTTLAAGFGSPGTAGADFLKIPSNTRAAGMAGAVVASSDGLEALEYNPARLSTLLGWELSGQHLSYALGVNLEQLAFGWGRPGLGAGLSVLSLSTPDIPSTDLSGAVTGSFKQQDLAYSAGGAWGHGPVSVGVLGRGIQRSLAGLSYSGLDADVGLAWDVWGGWRLGATAQHLGSLGALSEVADPAPLTFRGGLGWRHESDTGLSVNTELDAVQSRDAAIQARFGLEAGWSYFFGRVGTQISQAYEGRQPFSVGAGIRFSSWQLDYSFADLQGLGSAQRLGLSWRLDGAIRGRKGLAATTGIRAKREGNVLNFAWEPVKGAAGYAVYVRKGPQASLVKVGHASASQPKTRLKQASVLEIGFAVASLTEDGAESALSEELLVKRQDANAEVLLAPRNLRLEKVDGLRTLRWDASTQSGEFSYQVMVSRRSGSGYVLWGKPTYQTQKALPRGEEAWKDARFIVIKALRAQDQGNEESETSVELNVLP